MDADNSPELSKGALKTAPGGAVEPANRAKVAKDLFQTPIEVAGERYELRDPFAEVTYRSNRMAEISAKADQLGSNRFIAIDAEGKRSTVQRVGGEWQRGPQRPAPPERPIDTARERELERDEVPDRAAGHAAELAARSSTKSQAVPDAADATAIARLDAKAERAALVARIEAALIERYLIKRAPVTVGDVTIGSTASAAIRRASRSPSRLFGLPLTRTALRLPARWSMWPKPETGAHFACLATRTSGAWSGSRPRCVASRPWGTNRIPAISNC